MLNTVENNRHATGQSPTGQSTAQPPISIIGWGIIRDSVNAGYLALWSQPLTGSERRQLATCVHLGIGKYIVLQLLHGRHGIERVFSLLWKSFVVVNVDVASRRAANQSCRRPSVRKRAGTR